MKTNQQQTNQSNSFSLAKKSNPVKKLALATLLGSMVAMSFAFNFTVTNQSKYNLKVYNGKTGDTHVVYANTTQTMSLLDSNAYTVQYQYGSPASTDTIGSITRDANSGYISLGVPQSAAPAEATWYANNVTIGGKTFGSTQIQNWPSAPAIPGCVNGQYDSVCNGSGTSASVIYVANAPTPNKAVVSDQGQWNPNRSYDVTWSPTPVTYPVVQYNGQNYVACSAVAAGAIPGAESPWNAWELYKANGTNCSGAI